MEHFISASVSSFSQFLSDNKTILKETNSGNALISFAIPNFHKFKDLNLDYYMKFYERSFYFEKPDEKFYLLGVGEAIVISENGEKRFAAIDRKIKELKNNIVNNWNTLTLGKIPVFVGGMKFSSEHSDNDWKDFNDSAWFIPEIMFIKEKDKSFLFFNSINSSRESLINKFKTKLEFFFNTESAKVSSSFLKVYKVEGNSPKEKKKWKNQVNSCLEKIFENEIKKIVLARKVELLISDQPSFNSILNQFRIKYHECNLFIYHQGKSTFFGASPETLAKFNNGSLEIDVLAGSAKRGSTDEEDLKIENELKVSSKNILEHEIVIEHIQNSLNDLTDNFIISNHSIKKLANIQHIWTKISFSVKPGISIFNLIKELHPTPAISGLPKEMAIQLIKKTEGFRRGLYGGIIGWFNLNEEGEFAIAIRSALICGSKIIVYAGCGIVEHSDPDEEWNETELKLNPILSLFNNENKN